KNGRSLTELKNEPPLVYLHDAIVGLHRFGKSPLQHVSIRQQIVSVGISRIEGDRCGKISLSLRPVVTAPIDVTRENKERRAIGQTGTRDGQFFQRAIVVPVASEQKISHGEVRFG